MRNLDHHPDVTTTNPPGAPMIWQLAREQVRSQRRYLVWTAVLLAITVALASFWAFSYSTQRAADQASAHITGDDREWHGEIYATSGSTNAGDASHDATVNFDELNSVLAQAQSNGSDVSASIEVDAGLERDTSDPSSYFDPATARVGDVDWDTILVEGTSPAHGEVVISADYASRNDLTIGDTVALVSIFAEGADDSVANLTVSGLSYSPVPNAAVSSWAGAVHVAWEDASVISQNAYDIAYRDAPLATQDAPSLFVRLDWNTGDPAIDAILSTNGATSYGARTYDTSSNSTYYALVAGAAMVLGLIAMAFAVGRSQAQARMTWVATARTLGASRRTIAIATLAETLIVGLGASAVGITLGYLGTALTLAQARATVVEPALPTNVSATWDYVGLLLAFGMLVAGIIGVIPAFWASRISPVAALKPVADVNEAQASRRINPRYATVTWAASAVTLAVIRAAGVDTTLLSALEILLVVVVAVLTFVVLLEALRWAIPRIGMRWSASGRPWAIAAGDTLVARPRQAAIPAFVMSLGVAVLTVIITHLWVTRYVEVLAYGRGDTAMLIWQDSPIQKLIIFIPITYAIVALITIAIWAANHRSSAADAATREALGLTKASSRLAAGVGYALPLLAGIVTGWCLAAFVYAWAIPGVASLDSSEALTSSQKFDAVVSAAWPVLLVLAAGVLTAAIGAVAVSLTTSRAETPIRQLQDTH